MYLSVRLDIYSGTCCGDVPVQFSLISVPVADLGAPKMVLIPIEWLLLTTVEL